MKKRTISIALLLGAALLLSGCSKDSNHIKGFKLGEYKNIEVDRIVSTITEEDLAPQIEEELNMYAEYKEITNRAAKEGDACIIDFIGYLDGEEIEDGSENDCEVTIGSGEFIDGFEEGIIGMKVGETKDVPVTFPEEYFEELGGKEASFKITLKAITEVIRPEFDDAFVKETTSYSSVAEYKAATIDELQKNSDADASYMAAYDALSIIVDNSELTEYPEEEVAKMAEQIEADTLMFAEQFGMDIKELYGEDYDPTEEAKGMLKERIVVRAIADAEKLTVSDEEYNDYISDILLMEGYETVEDYEQENPKDETLYQMLYEKVIQFLSTNSKFNDVPEEEYYGFGDDIDFEEDGMLFEDSIEDYPELMDAPEVLDINDFEEGSDESEE